MFSLQELLTAFVWIFVHCKSVDFTFVSWKIPKPLWHFSHFLKDRNRDHCGCSSPRFVDVWSNIQNVKHAEHAADSTPRLKGNTLLPWWELYWTSLLRTILSHGEAHYHAVRSCTLAAIVIAQMPGQIFWHTWHMWRCLASCLAIYFTWIWTMKVEQWTTNDGWRNTG